jgi:hypothetical protein
MLTVDRRKICFLVLKGRQFQVKEADPLAAEEPSSPIDDVETDVFIDDPGEDAVRQELRALLAAMDERELAETLALMWLGREDIDTDDWDDAVTEARDGLSPRTSDHVIQTPLFPYYLEEGLARFGLSCNDIEGEEIWTESPPPSASS